MVTGSESKCTVSLTSGGDPNKGECSRPGTFPEEVTKHEQRTSELRALTRAIALIQVENLWGTIRVRLREWIRARGPDAGQRAHKHASRRRYAAQQRDGACDALASRVRHREVVNRVIELNSPSNEPHALTN